MGIISLSLIEVDLRLSQNNTGSNSDAPSREEDAEAQLQVLWSIICDFLNITKIIYSHKSNPIMWSLISLNKQIHNLSCDIRVRVTLIFKLMVGLIKELLLSQHKCYKLYLSKLDVNFEIETSRCYHHFF